MRRLVVFSSTSRFTKERSPIASERAVAGFLATGEAETRSFCEEHLIAWTILRPTLIYAEGQDRSITRLANIIRRIGVLPLAGAGSGKRQPVHADDLAVGALAAAGSVAAENRAYDVPGGETLSYRLMSERIFQSSGPEPQDRLRPSCGVAACPDPHIAVAAGDYHCHGFSYGGGSDL